MRKVEFRASVSEEGKVFPDDSDQLRERLKKLSGKRVHVTVERESEDKTLRQLGYFFSTVVPAWAEGAGYELDEMYESLWLSCMPYRATVDRLTGEERTYQPRLSDATKEEASQFLDRCIREAALAGFEVPEPSYRA